MILIGKDEFVEFMTNLINELESYLKKIELGEKKAALLVTVLNDKERLSKLPEMMVRRDKIIKAVEALQSNYSYMTEYKTNIEDGVKMVYFFLPDEALVIFMRKDRWKRFSYFELDGGANNLFA